MIRQIHLEHCDSTQDEIKEQLLKASSGESLIVSCENQISGRGRGENKWTTMPGTLCFSMNIDPHPVMSFSAIELSVILSEFFNNKGHKISLKWPNDLWNHDKKKCGGILVQGHQSNLLAGIGLNLWSDNKEYGGISDVTIPLDKKSLSYELADYIVQHRIYDWLELRRRWLNNCGHLKHEVRITDGEKVIEGIFTGIGDYGEALIDQNGSTLKIYNGSLRLI